MENLENYSSNAPIEKSNEPNPQVDEEVEKQTKAKEFLENEQKILDSQNEGVKKQELEEQDRIKELQTRKILPLSKTQVKFKSILNAQANPSSNSQRLRLMHFSFFLIVAGLVLLEALW